MSPAMPESSRIDPALASDPISVGVAERDRDMIRTVKDAVRSRSVALAFQPVFSTLRPDQPSFYEGLIRVMDPSGRAIPAREFIGIVETLETGRMIDCLSLELGLLALQQDPQIRLSVNMSARSIAYPAWMRTLEKGLLGQPTVAERLILEITESSAMLIPDSVQVFMDDLQQRGISFALDDFGAGFTAFRYLRDFFFDILKIDSQFIKGISGDLDNQVLTKALISIGRHFEMVTVAEGVETAADAAWLTSAGVDCMQGFHFSAPFLCPAWTNGDGSRRTG